MDIGINGGTMKRFILDIKKYFKYIIYATKSELKAEVANSHLNWLWWILDPVCFMLIYTFLVEIVFHTKEANFPVFVFIGLTVWNFFSKTLTTCVKIVSSNQAIVSKVYIPKFVLILVKLGVNFFKMSISWILILGMMIFFQVPFSWQLLNFFPLILILFLFTFACCTIVAHFGVFIEDLLNITNIFLKLVFYLSGIFYAIPTRIPTPYNHVLVNCNPVALFIDSFRKIILYNNFPDYLMLGCWCLIGVFLLIIGIHTIYKYENSYAKVIK